MSSPGRFLRLLIPFVLPWFYFLTRSPRLASDALNWLGLIERGNPKELYYGYFHHFLMPILSNWLMRGMRNLGWAEFSPLDAMLVINTASLMLGAWAIGKVAHALIQSDSSDSRKCSPADWIASLLFLSSYAVWHHWNGEAYALSLGMTCLAVHLAIQNRLFFSSFAWAIAVLNHAEFLFLAPVFAVIYGKNWKSTLAQWLGAAGLTLGLLFVIAAAIGKFSNWNELVTWYLGSHDASQDGVRLVPEPIRALKGFITSFTVSGHVFSNFVRSNPHHRDGLFYLALFAGLFEVGTILASLWIGISKNWARIKKPVILFLAWFLVPHALFNSFYCPGVEEYHSLKLPGLVLLVTAALVQLPRWMPTLFVFVFAGTNLVSGILPMRAIGLKNQAALEYLNSIQKEHPDTALLMCSRETPWILEWKSSLAIQNQLDDETRDRVRDSVRKRLGEWNNAGKKIYVLGPVCEGARWNEERPIDKALPDDVIHFDFRFLEAEGYRLVPTPIIEYPLNNTVLSNPFNTPVPSLFELSR